jgi:hypothetical protein
MSPKNQVGALIQIPLQIFSYEYFTQKYFQLYLPQHQKHFKQIKSQFHRKKANDENNFPPKYNFHKMHI